MSRLEHGNGGQPSDRTSSHDARPGQDAAADAAAPVDDAHRSAGRPSNLATALCLAQAGLPVFPCDGDKRPLIRWKEGATTEPEIVRTAWQRFPEALVGLPTGAVSGLFVIDIDTDRKTGEAIGEHSLALLGYDDLLRTGTVAETPSGGYHLYFRHPGPGFGNSVGTLGRGLDTRGDGGYVIAPGSSGARGRYVLRRGSLDQPEELPDALRRRLSVSDRASVERRGARDADSWAHAALHSELADILAAPKGSRNHRLNRAAFSLGQIVGGGGLDRTDVRNRLDAAGNAIGLTMGERTRTLESGLTAGERSPRRPDRTKPTPTELNRRESLRSSSFFCPTRWVGAPVPPRDWLVHELVPMRTVTLLGGDGGTGKSLVALQLAIAAAAERGWLGRAVQGGDVVVISAEDDEAELHRRLDGILRGLDLGFEALSRLTLRSLAGEDALLADEMDGRLVASPLFGELEAACAGASLVVIDTLADVYPANENDRAKVRQFIGLLRGLALRTGAAVLLLAHPSLTGLSSGSGLSGSTAWNNSVRSRLYLSRIAEDGYEPDPDQRVLRTLKSNYARTGGEISMRYANGSFVADARPSGLDRASANALAERVFLKLLRLMEQQGRHVSAQPGPTYAPTKFAAHPDAEGVRKRALTGAMEALLSREQIRIARHGTGSRQRSHLEIVDQQ